MKKYLRQNFWKVALLSFALLIVVSTLTRHTTVSADKTLEETKTIRESSHSNLEIQDERVKQIIESPVFAEADIWIKQYLEGNFRNDVNSLIRGENLASNRRELFKELIKLAPKTALEYAIPEETKNHLPASIVQYLERRISAKGDFQVYVLDMIDHTTGQMTEHRTEREVIVGETKYKAFVYGRRESITTKLQIPLQGVIVNDVMAVDENSLRKVEPLEYSNRNVDLKKIGEYGAVAEVGGELMYFSHQQELENYERELIEWEAKISPVRPDIALKPQELASPWTEGLKTVLVIRVDFSDRPGEPLEWNNQPLTTTRAQNLFVNEVNPFYMNNSYNKTSLQATVTSVVRMPQAQSFYFSSGNLYQDARNAARAAGFETNNYSLEVIAMSYNQGFPFAGSAGLGEKGVVLNGYFDLGVTAHELGHNYGLIHANLWRTTDGTVIGQGNHIEYGDCFDVMGCGNAGQSSHFNTHYKRLLNWLTDANVQAVTSNGVYRIFAQDSSSPGGIRTLKIRKSATKNYWVEFRQLFTDNPNAMNGAIIRWDHPSVNYGAYFRETQLLDMTPTTPMDVKDAPLLIGQSFNDSENRIRMTVIGKGNTTPESLDVRVELNVGCTFNLSSTTQQVSPGGGVFPIPVDTQTGCRPPITSDSPWLAPYISDQANQLTVEPNYTGIQRTGILTLGGQSIIISQAALATACINPPNGLIGWWRGDGSVLDQTGRNHGTLNREANYVNGKIATGFKNSVIIPEQFPLPINNSISVEGWIKPEAYNFSQFFKRSGAALNPKISHSMGIYPDGKVGFFINDNSLSSDGIVSTVPISLNQFTHIAVTFNDSTGNLAMYLNGILNTQRIISERPVFIGQNENPQISLAESNNIVDEFSIYDRPLTATEIQPLATAGNASGGAAGKCLSRNAPRALYDFDGDGRSDISVFRSSNSVWYLNQSQNGFTGATFGFGTDRIIPADYDSDGKTDIAVYRDGTWYLQRSQSGFTGIAFGTANDIPVPADYDGDGKSDIAVFRPSNGTWYLQRSNLGFTGVQFGQNGDQPAAADYDGDGKADVAVNRSGTWYIQRSQFGFTGVQFGIAGDAAVPADYDGDGKADVAVFRPSTGTWYLQRSAAGFTGIQFGTNTDAPTPADYDGDGKTDVAVFRPSTGAWYLQRSTQGFTGVTFGTNGDKPIPNAFINIIRSLPSNGEL